MDFQYINITDEQRNTYLDNGGAKCPFCNSEDLHTGDVETDIGAVTQDVTCHSCYVTWTDVYNLSDITSVYQDATPEYLHKNLPHGIIE